MALYLACDLEDYEPVTGACSSPYYIETEPSSGSVLPPLTLEDGAAIGAAILGVWAVAFAFRAARKALDI